MRWQRGEALDYAAFGERRSSASPFNAGGGSPTTDRGFTGHEMLDGTDVIHMNGRIYDAQLGRFLQADPVIQAPDNAQSWNAYTYVFNNPLAYTDPSGNISLRQALGIVGGGGGDGVCAAVRECLGQDRLCGIDRWGVRIRLHRHSARGRMGRVLGGGVCGRGRVLR
jgi:RHS repeat-associated protein